MSTYTLDTDQQSALNSIIALCEQRLSGTCSNSGSDSPHVVVVIQGAAGTGKSVLLTSLFIALSSRSRMHQSDEIPSADALSGINVRIMVNHAQMWKRYKDIAGNNPQLRKSQVLRPTPYINTADRNGKGADIALVDEAHLLLTQPNPYMHFHAENQLKEIVRLSKITVIAYDEAQVLRLRSMWNDDVLSEALNDAEVINIKLGTQHRMGASLGVRNWIESLLDEDSVVSPPPSEDQGFEMKVFADAGKMRDAIVERSSRGSARLLSTYDYPYRLDGADYFIDEPGLHIPWDRYVPQASLAWPQRPETLNEVGSVYTIQGLDLDWAGVILGPSNVLSDQGTLCVKPDVYQDQAAFAGVARLLAKGLDAHEIEHSRERVLRNALMTLLTRPRKGLFLYEHNPQLLHALCSIQ